MRRSAQKQQRAPQPESGDPARGSFREGPGARSILQAQATIGNQAVQTLLRERAEGPEAGAEQLRLEEPVLGASREGARRPSATATHVLEGFGTDSAELTSDHQTILQRVAAELLNAQPLLVGGFVTIEGFADRRGTDEHNRDLGQRRADAVRARLSGSASPRTPPGARSVPTPSASLKRTRLATFRSYGESTITITQGSHSTGLLPPLSDPTAPTPPAVDLDLPPQLQPMSPEPPEVILPRMALERAAGRAAVGFLPREAVALVDGNAPPRGPRGDHGGARGRAFRREQDARAARRGDGSRW